ncbi:MAG: RtcB family protein [Tepidisphaeraceae bacterium]|jgi:tRNA-splicing ligase RtcB
MSDVIMHQWTCGRIPSDADEAIARIVHADDVRHVAIMPDIHAAGVLCNGVVIGTGQLVYPEAVGGDIGCGYAAVKLDAAADALNARAAAELLIRLRRVCPWNRLPRAGPWPPELDVATLSHPSLQSIARRDGAVQLGTLGRGNHFLELQAEVDGSLWLMVHSGSRAIGPAVRDHHLTQTTRGAGGLKRLDSDTDAGRAYLRDMEWARRYAAASRRAMIASAATLVEEVLDCGTDWDTYVDIDHNHVQLEPHAAGELWVHRKGASPACAGQRVLIPGSMGTATFHAEGQGNSDSLCSSSHGAGRAWSRQEARRRIGEKDVRRQLGSILFDPGVLDALREEAPAAYKDVRKVMEAQRDLVRIVRRMRTLLSHKGA